MEAKGKHKIGWLNLPGYKGETWNPVAGCSKVSEGCEHCYAERMARRLAGNPKTSYYSEVIKDGKWNGITVYSPSILLKVLSWRTPRVVFVCSMGDLFHEDVKFGEIDKVMALAALLPQHIFIILTKRADRMAKYFGQGKEALVRYWENASYEMGISVGDDVDAPSCFIHNRCMSGRKVKAWGWPLSNVWVGVTAENQAWANERIPYLLQIEAAVRFVSVEPMLGPMDLEQVAFSKFRNWVLNNETQYPLDWVICGGESGYNARAVHPDWVRGLRDQCKGAGVPFFFKQWGEWLPMDHTNEDAYLNKKRSIEVGYGWTTNTMNRVGKKLAGNELDGKKWEEWPKNFKV